MMIDTKFSKRLDAVEDRLVQVEKILGIVPPQAESTPNSCQQNDSTSPRMGSLVFDKTAPAGEPNLEEAYALRGDSVDSSPTIGVSASANLSSDTPDDLLADFSGESFEDSDNHSPILSYPSKSHSEPNLQPGLEQTIGLQWAGWIGAMVLVIGAGLGIKYGYDQGWFRILPPAFRLGFFAAAGLALIAAGEWVYRRINTLSAAGLFGSGIAVLFVVSYAGHAYYDLYPKNSAFIFMGVSTLIGALVARRGNLVSIAVLSMLGGNLAPLLLSQGQSEFTGFLSYLLLLQLVALILAACGGSPKWWTLRGLSWVTTSLWILAIIDQAPVSTLLPFSAAFALFFQAELLISAVNRKLIAPTVGSTFCLLVTASFTACAIYVLKDSSEATRLSVVLAVAGVTCLWTFICKTLASSRPPFGQLSISFAVQTLALVAAAVPLAFSGIWISVAWAVLAIAFAGMGYLIDSPITRYAAPITWLLAIIALSISDVNLVGSHKVETIVASIAGIDVQQKLVLRGLLAIMGLIVSVSMSLRREEIPTEAARQIGVAMSVLAGALWSLACLAGLPALVATTFILAYALLLLLLDCLDIKLFPLTQAALLTAGCILKWAMFDTLAHRLFGGQAYEPLLLSARGIAQGAIVIALIGVYFRAMKPRSDDLHAVTIRQFGVGLLVLILFWIGTFTIDQALINDRTAIHPLFADPGRAEGPALSIFWSLFAIASIAGGFGWRNTGLRYFGLGLFALTLLKVVLLDMNQVSTGYRILSFMGLGILLLITSVLYGKLSPVLLRDEQRESPIP